MQAVIGVLIGLTGVMIVIGRKRLADPRARWFEQRATAAPTVGWQRFYEFAFLWFGVVMLAIGVVVIVAGLVT